MTIKALISNQILVGDVWASGAVLHQNGVIIGVVSTKDVPPEAIVDDCASLVVLPGLVDSHVHINEPGRTEWEGFNTATQAAAAGGITTVVDMPLNCIPVTTSLAALKTKLGQLDQKLWVDCSFHGGVVPGNTEELELMVKAGVKSFKAFMIDSGIEEFAFATRADLAKAMPILAKNDAVLLLHAEVDGHNPVHSGEQSYAAFLASRPPIMENKAIELVIDLARKTGCRVHIVHLSSAEALPMIREAKREGVKITAETCPHYLTLKAETIPDGDGRFKCMPPIRNAENAEALWQGLKSGDIDFIVSDHSPCTPALKKLESKNLVEAWGGISSLQFGLPLVWTEMKSRGIPLENVGRWLCFGPALLAGLETKKGRIQRGFSADFTVFDPQAHFKITKERIFHRHKETPYEGRSCYGIVRATWLRGEKIFAEGRFLGQPSGERLL